MSEEEDSGHVYIRLEPELKAWLKAEKKQTQRSINWLVNHAVALWRARLDKQRESKREDG